MNMCIDKINSDSSEQKYVHLSNGLIQNFEICYTFRVGKCSGYCGFVCENVTVHCSVVVCNYVLPYFLCLKECVEIYKVWIHSVVRLDKRDKAYKAQAHCLTYMFTGLHEVYYPQWLPFHLMGPLTEKKVLFGRTVVCLSHPHFNTDIEKS